ncbi:MAG: efflux RND transporter periplasmic adaptor subunit [Candidatus Sericytochromatia bacterium]
MTSRFYATLAWLVTAALLRLSTLAPALSQEVSLPSASSTESPAEGEDGTGLVSPREGTFVQSVKLVGNIEARNQRYLAPAFSTRLEMLAEDGAMVKKDAVVARLDVKTVEENLDEQKLELEAARNAVVEHDRTTASDKVRLGAEIQRAQAVVEQKSLAARLLQQGTRPEELQKLMLTRDLANEALKLSQSTLTLKEKLAAKGISTQLEVLQAQLDLTNKERDRNVASAEYNQAKAGATPLARQIAQLDLQKAQVQLSWAQKNLTLTLDQAALTRQKLVAKQQSVEAQVKQMQSQMQRAVLKAPMAGTVVLNKSWTNEGLKRIAVGDNVYEGNPFMSVADLSQVVIQTELDETLLRDVKIGMTANFQLPSLRGRRFSGKVVRLGVLAHERTGRQNTEGLSQVFDLEIQPSAQDAVFQPGTSVDLELPLKQRQKVLMLPRQAVQRVGEQHLVTLANGEQREVKLGEANAQDVIILEGLTPTDQVKLLGTSPSAEAPTP